jgi:hypothetical protein
MVAISLGGNILIGVASAWLAVVTDGQRISKISIFTSSTVLPFIPPGAGSASVLLWSQGVLVIVYGCYLTGGAEVIGRNIQWALARLAIIWSPKTGVSIKSHSTLFAMVAHSVMLASSAFECGRITGG